MEEIMQLRPYVEADRLKWKPRLTDPEKAHFSILSKAYRLLRATHSESAAEVRNQAVQILRVRYHRDHDAMYRNNRLNEAEWSAVQEYFPDRFHRQYFSSSMFGEPVNEYLRVADRVFENVTIRGNNRRTDFIILGTEPGRSEPSFLARMYKSGAAAPHIYEIKSIVEVRRSFWHWSKPGGIGVTTGALIGLWANIKYGSAPIFEGDWLIPLCMLIGMGIAFACTSYVNRKKSRAIRTMYPHLCIAE